jgi:DNA-binding GntR family transcriptional regulator
VLVQLRADILGCRLKPNERLTLEALKRRYGAGWSPIREALMRLASEGLVELEQNKGFRVSRVSRDHLVDLMQSRIEIENLALQRAITKGNVEWEANLLAAFHCLSKQNKISSAQPRTINPQWSMAHRAFGSPTLLSIRDNLFAQTERYVTLAILSKWPPRNDVAEHARIMEATLARNAVRATALNREHIERTLNKVVKSLQRHPEFSKSGAADLADSRLALAG